MWGNIFLMKRKIISFFTLLATSLTLSSCSFLELILGISSNTNTSSIYVPDPSEIGDGYYVPKSMEYKATDYDPAFSPSIGDVKILIIPIQFKASVYTKTYTTLDYNIMNQRYFSDDSNSLKTYYKNASHDQLNISGEVAKTYVTSLSSVTVNDYTNEDFSLFLTSVYDWTINNNPNIDFSQYDSDNDGYIDSVHFMTNLNENAFNSLDSSGNLWPHMWYLNNDLRTDNKPSIDVYLCTSYGMINDTTAIHEQGHVFGVDDYYNYSESRADYVGGADMQDLNCFDWNSYSKLLMDWVKPYVVDGSSDETTITIKPASTSGDCILIPANHSTWNGSAYDEYLLIELFTNSGNNSPYWSNWTTTSYQYGLYGATSLKEGGIRLYHVDSRLYGFNKISESTGYYVIRDGEYIDNPKTTPYRYVCLPQTNSKNNYDYTSFYVPSSKDYKLLSLIQAGGINTFVTSSSHNALAYSDLFHTGDKFTMSKYSRYFIDNKFNNGESFPYEIDFNLVSEEKATITIRKIK